MQLLSRLPQSDPKISMSQLLDLLDTIAEDLRKFSVKKPGFNYGYLKRSTGDGFQKFDHVEITKTNGKWKGIINCFDRTPKNKPRRLRVGYFAPEVADPRKSGNSTELRLLQKRDRYSTERSNHGRGECRVE